MAAVEARSMGRWLSAENGQGKGKAAGLSFRKEAVARTAKLWYNIKLRGTGFRRGLSLPTKQLFFAGEILLMSEKNTGVFSKLSYISRILRGVRLEELGKALEKGKKRSGKNKAFLFFDMLWCAARYGAGYHDYVMFAFYNMNPRQRASYVTRVKNKRLITLLNDPQAADSFDQKTLFYPKFREFLNREFLVMAEAGEKDFLRFLEGKDTLFAKPDVGESGKGIEKLKVSDFESPSALYAYVKKHGFGTVEEALVQHEALSKLYPLSVNSMRVVTLLTKGEKGEWVSHCVYAVQKIGNGGKFVDNLENGGMFCPVDLETGKLTGVGHTSALETIEVHPVTKIPLIGYRIPFAKEAVELCKRAALKEPRMRLVGWDVCITPKGPAIIEGNDYPGYDFWQQPEHTPDHIGLWPYYKKMLPELSKN